MASLPIILNPGEVAVYGTGNPDQSNPAFVSPNGTVFDQNQKYGTVYNIWDGGAPYIYGGDVVIFKEQDVICRIVTSNQLTYTILPVAKLVTQSIEYLP